MVIKRIYLVGFMGSGKSTLGKRLRSELGWEFLDLDDYFEERYQMTIKQYFAQFGEDAFRLAEKELLLDVSQKERLIIATGGGAPCYFNNMQVMNDTGLTIYIKLSVETLAGRLSSARQVRPLVAGKSGTELHQYIEEKLQERDGFYNQAKVIADGEVLGVDGFVRIIKASGELM
ncbi:shikimate kinase [Carboxylicivirga mesophila]|uniref:Shikimate kinase n=1 Tax=Carboxylicivirga mesophila TaxID=1166478 RepID=A0ABS5K6C4_9BACT|nr:shikimate kinase [Carboxylicivirga mesophila]MBS2210520.1 shikimate kinase [Carboxylicivirga mesophila]